MTLTRSTRFLLVVTFLMALILVRLDIHPRDEWPTIRGKLANFACVWLAVVLAAMLLRWYRVQDAKDKATAE